jgi:hypothetical protein
VVAAIVTVAAIAVTAAGTAGVAASAEAAATADDPIAAVSVSDLNMIGRLPPMARLGLAMVLFPLVCFGGWLWFDLAGLGELACFLFVPVGICLAIHSTILWRQEEFADLLRACSFTQRGPTAGNSAVRQAFSRAIFARRKAAVPSMSSWRWASMQTLILTIFFSLVVDVFFTARAMAWIVPTGLPVRLLTPRVTNTQRSAGLQPLVVRIASSGTLDRPLLYVDSEPVPWKKFGGILRKELDRRPPNWPVYFKGDPNMDWRFSAEAIDAIQAERGKVVLLTRRSWANR